jgi:hypothetical protein
MSHSVAFIDSLALNVVETRIDPQQPCACCIEKRRQGLGACRSHQPSVSPAGLRLTAFTRLPDQHRPQSAIQMPSEARLRAICQRPSSQKKRSNERLLLSQQVLWLLLMQGTVD